MKKAKALMILLAMSLTVSMPLAGCKKSGDENQAGTQKESAVQQTAATTEKSKEKFKIEVSENDWGTKAPATDMDFIKQELDQKLNIDLQLSNASGNDYTNQINVRIASGNYPDMFDIPNRSYLIQYAQNGVLLDLSNYMEKLSDYTKFVGENAMKTGIYKDKVYAITKPANISYQAYWIRKDWLDALKLNVPTTIDELFDVAKAFTENDPDGNGKKDTYGLSGDKLGTFRQIFGGYGVTPYLDFYIQNGEMVSTVYQPALKDALISVKKFVDAGVVDPDFMINDGTKVQQKAIQGKVGIVASGWDKMDKDPQREQIKAVNPNARWIAMNVVSGPNGAFDGGNDIGKNGGYVGIPTTMDKNPDKLERIFDLLNYVSSEEGNRLVQFGIEGRHYNVENGKVVPTELMGKEAGFTFLYQFTGRPASTYLQTKFAAQAESIKFAAELPRITAVNGFIDAPENYNFADVNKYFEEEMTKFIFGERSIDELGNFVNTLNTTYGFETYFNSAKEQIKKLGYTK